MITNLKYGEIKKEIVKFVKTVYGKCIFVICYTPFLFSFIATSFFLSNYLQDHINYTGVRLAYLSFLSLVCFCIGSYNFYRELRVYVSEKTKDSKEVKTSKATKITKKK